MTDFKFCIFFGRGDDDELYCDRGSQTSYMYRMNANKVKINEIEVALDDDDEGSC